MPETVMPNFVQPSGIPALAPVQQYPTPYGTSQGGGTGGLVDRNKIINDSVQNAINQTQQLEKMQRDRQAYQEQQKGQHEIATGGIPAGSSFKPPEQQSFTDSLLHGLSSLGSGIRSIFGGSAPDTNAPGAQQVGPPVSAAAPQMQGPAAPVQSQMDGGVVSPPQGTVPQFQKPLPSVLAFEAGGAIPANLTSGFGVMDGGGHGIRGFEDGGQIPGDQGPPAPAHAAAAQAQLSDVIDKLHGDMHAHALGDDDQPNHSRAVPADVVSPQEAKLRQQTGSLANGQAAPEAQMVDTQAPPTQGAAPPTSPQGATPAAPDPAIAASASAIQAVQNAPPSDPSKTGVQTTSPSAEGKPHSISPEKWDDWDQRIDKAVYYAGLAGHDPGQVRQALEANRNAYIQGHVLRYLASANVALQNGDQKGVEAAMRNAYYYMPDGQELTVQKNAAGQLMYQDPVNPVRLDGNNKPLPNMIPVDAAHLQLLGQAMLDPMQVNRTIMEVRSAASVQQLKAAQARAAVMTGEGNLAKGQGILATGESHLGRVNSQNYKDLAEGDAARVRATALANHLNNLVHQNKIDPSLIRGAQDAATAFANAVQGQQSTIPGANDPNNINPNAGKTTRDPTKSTLPGATPEDVLAGSALASDIFVGGGGTKSPAEAARLATLAQTAKRSTHPGPDGKPQADFMTDTKTGDTHVWNKALKKWEAFRLPLTSANDAANGKLGVTADDLDDATKAELASNGGIQSSPSGSQQGAASEPDMQDQQMVDDDQKS